MNLRIRYPPSNPLLEIAESLSLADLYTEVGKKIIEAADSFDILHGFPLRPVVKDNNTTISSRLEEGDVICVQLKSSGPSQTANGQQCATTRGRGRRAPLLLGSSQEEWAVNLLSIFNKTGSLTRGEAALKGAFRTAVAARYRATEAEKRWAAAQGKMCSFSDVDRNPQRFRVTYPVSPRRTAVEEYSILPLPFLSAVLRQVLSMNDKDAVRNLRPYYMAERQPLIFWNIVRCFPDDFILGLKTLVPEAEWPFLENRERRLSAKAAENRRQWEEEQERMRRDRELLEQRSDSLQKRLKNDEASAPYSKRIRLDQEVSLQQDQVMAEDIQCISPSEHKPEETTEFHPVLPAALVTTGVRDGLMTSPLPEGENSNNNTDVEDSSTHCSDIEDETSTLHATTTSDSAMSSLLRQCHQWRCDNAARRSHEETPHKMISEESATENAAELMSVAALLRQCHMQRESRSIRNSIQSAPKSPQSVDVDEKGPSDFIGHRNAIALQSSDVMDEEDFMFESIEDEELEAGDE